MRPFALVLSILACPSLPTKSILSAMNLRSSPYRGWLLCWWLAAALPLISCYAKNYPIFSARQLSLSAGLLMLAVLAVFTVYHGLARLILRRLARISPRWKAQEVPLFDFAMALGAAAVYLRLTLYPLSFAIVRQMGWTPLAAGLVLLLLFALYALIAWRFLWKGTSALLAVLIAWQGGAWISSLRGEKAESRALQIPDAEREIYDSVRFKTTPNIYFMVLESYHGAARLRDYYGFDNRAFTDGLAGMGFAVYSNVFANYYVTVQSLHATFSMRHHYNLQESGNMDSRGFRALFSGGEYNPVLSILKNNGYRIEYQLADTYLYFPEQARKHLDALMVAESNPLHPLATLVWPHLITDRIVPDYRERLLGELFENGPSASPRFVFMKAGVLHLMTPQWPPPSDSWKKSYVDKFDAENRFLSALCRRIQEKDPGAIVILAADHGAFGYSWGWWDRTEDPNSFFKAQGLDPVEVANDNADVFLAVKLDRPDAPPLPVRTLANLFRELFRYLSDDPRLPGTRVPDDAYSPRRNGLIHRIVREGTPLMEFERVETTTLHP